MYYPRSFLKFILMGFLLVSLPLLYALALQEKGEPATFFNDKVMTSISMTSVLMGG